jgi:HEAT repeat protein
MAWRSCIDAVLDWRRRTDSPNEHYQVRDWLEHYTGPTNALLPPLATILADREQPPQLRRLAAEYIGEHGHHVGDLDLLQPGLQDADREVRCESLRAIGQLAYAPYPAGRAGRAQHPEADRACQILIGFLTDDDNLVVGAALTGLRYMEGQAKPAMPHVIQLLQRSKEVWVRCSCLATLACIPDPHVAEVIRSCIEDEADAHVRDIAMREAGNYLSFLQRRNPATFDTSAALLVPAMLGYLQQIKDAGDASDIGQAFQAIGFARHHATDAVPVILSCATDKNRWLAVLALKRIGVSGPKVDEFMLASLKAKRSWTRKEAAEGLGNLGVDTRRIRRALVRLTRDPEPRVREAAIEAIDKLDSRAPAQQQHPNQENAF